MTGIVGHFLSGMIALHAVLGCCFHHAHVARQTSCCQNRAALAGECSCQNPSGEGMALVGSTCCHDAVTGQGDRTDCRERRCEWGVQGSGAGMPDVGAVAISATALFEIRLLRESDPSPEQMIPRAGYSRARLHAVLAIFLI